MRELKESNVFWLNKIPKDWDLVKGKYLYSIETGKLDANAEVADGEYPFFTCSMYPKRIDTFSFDCEALLVAGNGIVGYTQYYNGKFDAYQRTYVLSKFKRINPNFLKYYVSNNLSIEVKPNSVGSVIQFIKLGDLENFNICVPPMQEQERIVHLLDKKVHKINEIIEKTKKTIEDYKKIKYSLIFNKITKGIHDDVELKETGNIHIGKIPSNWNAKKIKYIFEIKKQIAGKEGYDVLSITQNGIKIKDVSKNEGQLADNYSNYQLVEAGDFAMNHMDLLTGWVDISKYNGVTSPDYRVFRFINKEQNDPKYYLFLMQMCYMGKIFYDLGQGVSNLGRWRLQADKFLNFIVPEPSLEEQKEISYYLEKKCNEIDNLILNKEKLIEELEKYKKSFIYEYVTGKKEVV